MQVGEEHLVEVFATIDLMDRADLDGRVTHVDHKHGDARVFGHGWIGTRDENAVFALMGKRGPDFLAVDDVLITVSLRLGLEAGDVAASPGLGEHLAPDVFASDTAWHELGLEFVGAKVVHHWHTHAVADG